MAEQAEVPKANPIEQLFGFLSKAGVKVRLFGREASWEDVQKRGLHAAIRSASGDPEALRVEHVQNGEICPRCGDQTMQCDNGKCCNPSSRHCRTVGCEGVFFSNGVWEFG